MTTPILGRTARLPIFIAPFAVSKASHPDGELALARAARSAGSCFCVPHFGNTPLEDVARAAGAMAADTGAPGNTDADLDHDVSPLLLQLYLPRSPGVGAADRVDRAVTKRLLEHAAACGCGGVVITVDTTVDGKREKTYLSTTWMKAVQEQLGGLPPVRTMQAANTGPYMGHARSLSWDDINWVCENSSGVPVLIKGIIAPEDAELCCRPDLGLSGIIVSNHGGRQLDGCEATADVLRDVCTAVAGRMPVFVDGGIRRGKDVFRALALGASAVFVGRPAHWGLGLGGQVGVERVLEILRDELERVMVLCGCSSLQKISPTHVRWAAAGRHPEGERWARGGVARSVL